MSIGTRIKEERTRLGLNQTEFGKLGGTTKKTQVEYEKTSGNPKSSYLTALVDADIGVDLIYVLTGKRVTRIGEPGRPGYVIESEKPETIEEVGMRLRASKEAYKSAVKCAECKPSNNLEEILNTMLFKGVINEEGICFLLKELQLHGDHIYTVKE